MANFCFFCYNFFNFNISKTIAHILLKFAPHATNKRHIMWLKVYIILLKFAAVRVICLLALLFTGHRY